MKIKCKKFLSESADRKELEISGALTKGREYIVLGISTSDRDRSFYIECDDSTLPGYFDVRQFDVVSNYLPSSWQAEYVENLCSLDFYPKSWIEADNFLERFVNDEDPDMIALFEKERDLIYREEAEYELKKSGN
jgi:hypothetical protein